MCYRHHRLSHRLEEYFRLRHHQLEVLEEGNLHQELHNHHQEVEVGVFHRQNQMLGVEDLEVLQRQQLVRHLYRQNLQSIHECVNQNLV